MGRLTADEAAVYDRQIRVWGAEAQGRLGGARVALWGGGPLAAEAAKNLALAGVGRLSVLPPPGGAPGDAGGPRNFLAAGAGPGPGTAAAMAATLSEMNPLVDTRAVPGEAADVRAAFGGVGAGAAAGAAAEAPPALLREALEEASLVIAVTASLAELREAASWSRGRGKPFFGALASGFSGMFFADLLEHAFTEKRPAPPPAPAPAGAAPSAEPVPAQDPARVLSFVPLEEALAVPWDALPRRCSPLFPALQVRDALERELGRAPAASDVKAALAVRGALAAAAGLPLERAPSDAAAVGLLEADGGQPAACSVLGGVLANEVLKAATHKGEPVRNFFFFSAADGAGKTEFLRPFAQAHRG